MTTAPTSRGALICGWTTLFLLAFTGLLLAIAGPAHRAGVLSLNVAFMMLLVAIIGAVLCVLLGTVATIWNVRRGSRGLALAAGLALVVGLGLMLNFAAWMLAGRDVPRIHDISTDTVDAPEFVAIVPLRADAPNPPGYAGGQVAEQQRAAYPDIEPIRIPAAHDAVFAAALSVVGAMDWALAAQAPGEGRIEATATTGYFGFRDDVVIRVSRSDDETIVDVRSKSRVGLSDLGTNAARIREFRERLLAEL